MTDEFCKIHSEINVRVEHLERRVCLMEKTGLKILIGIAFSLLTTVTGFVVLFFKLHPS